MNNQTIRQNEEDVLGVLMHSPNMIDIVREHISGDHFCISSYRVIWDAICYLSDKRSLVDAVEVATLIESNGNQDEWCNLNAIVGITQNSPSPQNVMPRVRSMCTAFLERRLTSAIGNICTLNGGSDDIEQKIGQCQEVINSIAQTDSDGGPVFVSDYLKDYFDLLERRAEGVEVGLMTGFENIDRHTNGFMPADLVIIAGRPSMGKTTFAMNIAENVACTGKKVLVFSLEMPKSQVLDRCVASIGEIPLSNVKEGLDESTTSRATASIIRIKDSMLIDDTGGLKVEQMRSRARRAKRRHGIELIVVDYLQLLHAKGESETVKIGKISQQLKEMAKELEIPVVALSQLNRDLEKRPAYDRMPVMSDLRQSGQIEQDADLIFMIYRDEVYNPDGDHKGMASVFLRKFRNGELGQLDMEFEGAFTRFKSRQRCIEYKRPEPKQPKGFGG